MPGPKPSAINLNGVERQELELLVRPYTTGQQKVIRARIVLLAAMGKSQTSAAHPAAELRGMRSAAARLIEIQQIHLLISFLLFQGSLLFNVVPNQLSSYTFTNCTDISSIAPKFAPPKFFFNFWKRFEHLFS